MEEQLVEKATEFLEEALPYIQKFKDKIVVVKYGGKAMRSEELKKAVIKDIALLKYLGIKPVIIHGGGPEITKEMELAGLKTVFVNGLRITDDATMKIVQKIFKNINAEIRENLWQLNVASVEINDCLISKLKDKNLGLVGEVIGVDKEKIIDAIAKDKIPVISSIGIGVCDDENGKKIIYNINADTSAAKIAVSLNAEKFTILTDVDGVNKNGELISQLSLNDAVKYIQEGIITEGMIPKVKACIEAVEHGCKKAHLINGTILHSLLFEIFTHEGVGTEIIRNGH